MTKNLVRIPVQTLVIMLLGIAPIVGATAIDPASPERTAVMSPSLPELEATLALRGPWELYPGRLLAPGSPAPEQAPLLVTLPDEGLWQSVPIPPPRLGAYGCATYRLRLILPPLQGSWALRVPEFFSAARLWFNGHEVHSAGTVGLSPDTARPWYRTGVVSVSPRPGVNEILIQVSNHHERRGGFNRVLQLGPDQDVKDAHHRSLALDLMVFGSLFTIGLYHLFLFILRPKDRSPLWFGLFCLIIALRSLLYGERFIFDLLPGIPFSLLSRLDHLTFYLGIPIFAAYLVDIFPEVMWKPAVRVYQGLGAIFALILAFPPSVYNVTVTWYEVITALYVGYILVNLARALARRIEGSLTTVVGLALFMGFGVNEILFNMGLISTFNTLPLGLVIFLLTQSFLLAMRFSKAFHVSESLGHSLLTLNASLRRFIPQEFFQLLQRHEVQDIRLGDQVEHRMTIMFTDIRGFTTLAERMGAAQTFEFLNEYFGRVGRVIREHGGFIDKYLGDGFIALFPGGPNQALGTAIGIQKEVTAFNTARLKEGLPAIEVGIGLNHGSMILGTVGEENRMDTTVIADSVNLSSRLEGLSKLYGKGTIVPFDFLDLLEAPESYHWRYLGMIRVQGRQEPVEVAHIFDGLPQADFHRFLSTRERFEDALRLYRNGEYPEAMEAFRALARETPEDPAVFTLMNQIHRLMVSGIGDDWDGVANTAK